MPNPTASDVHVNQPLTNISIAFIQDAADFVAGRVFPNIPVDKQADRYYTYDRGNFNRDEAELRAPGTESAGGGYTVDNTPTYFCDVWAFHKDIPDQVRANEDGVLNSDRDATTYVTLKCLIKREKRFMAKYMVGGLWTIDADGVTSGSENGTTAFVQWSDYTNSTPIKDIRYLKTAIKKSTGFTPNKLTLAQDVWDILLDHPDILDRLKFGQTAGKPAMVTREAVAAILEIDQIEIAGAIENTAAESITNSHAFICTKKALLCYATPTPGLLTPTAGYTFSWKGYLGAGSEGNRISKFRMEHLKSDRVEAEMAFDQKLVSADLGAFLDTIIA